MTDSNQIVVKKKNSNKIGKIIIGVVVFLAMSFLLTASKFMSQMRQGGGSDSSIIAESINLPTMTESKPQIDVSMLNVRINGMGELTTAQMDYDGVLEFEEGNIPLITRHGFLMQYQASVRAGIDFSAISVRIEGEKVVVSVPKAEVQVVFVDPESLEFYDTSHALFEGDVKQDVSESLEAAMEDVWENVDMSEVLDRADAEAENRICELIEQLVGECKIEFRRR